MGYQSPVPNHPPTALPVPTTRRVGSNHRTQPPHPHCPPSLPIPHSLSHCASLTAPSLTAPGEPPAHHHPLTHARRSPEHIHASPTAHRTTGSTPQDPAPLAAYQRRRRTAPSSDPARASLPRPQRRRQSGPTSLAPGQALNAQSVPKPHQPAYSGPLPTRVLRCEAIPPQAMRSPPGSRQAQHPADPTTVRAQPRALSTGDRPGQRDQPGRHLGRADVVPFPNRRLPGGVVCR